MMVGLMACKQRSETSEMPVVENIQHRATLEGGYLFFTLCVLYFFCTLFFIYFNLNYP